MSVIDKTLIWWRAVPVDVEMGLVEYLSKNWKGEIFILSCLELENERKICQWDKKTYEKVHFIYRQDQQEIIDQLFLKDAIHIFSGIKGPQEKYLKLLKKLNSKRKDCVLVCESPSAYGNKIKRLIKNRLYPLLYGYYWKKYGSMFFTFFTLGKKADKLYNSYGWSSNIIYPFMYLPVVDAIVDNYHKTCTDRLKGIYLGRFRFSTKGVDDLMKAIDIVNNPKLQMDFVGGYGEDKDKVIEWCERSSSAKYKGTWHSDEIIKRLVDYDFIVVPSKCEGWNMAPYQSVCAGIGCIVSDKAGSEDLIENSASGIVYKSGDYVALSKILKKILDNNSIVNFWKENALAFQKKITIDTVGSYFVDVIKYQIGETETQPNCPWERKK